MAAKCTGQDHGSEYEIALLNHMTSQEKSWYLEKMLQKSLMLKGGENVMKCFKVLCRQIKVTSLLDLIPGLNESDAEFVD